MKFAMQPNVFLGRFFLTISFSFVKTTDFGATICLNDRLIFEVVAFTNCSSYGEIFSAFANGRLEM